MTSALLRTLTPPKPHTMPYFIILLRMIKIGILLLQRKRQNLFSATPPVVLYMSIRKVKISITHCTRMISRPTLFSYSPHQHSTARSESPLPPPPMNTHPHIRAHTRTLTLIRTSQKILLTTCFGVPKSRDLIPKK